MSQVKEHLIRLNVPTPIIEFITSEVDDSDFLTETFYDYVDALHVLMDKYGDMLVLINRINKNWCLYDPKDIVEYLDGFMRNEELLDDHEICEEVEFYGRPTMFEASFRMNLDEFIKKPFDMNEFVKY